MQDLKYILVPGWVRSKNDGDMHRVGIKDLIKLYRLQPNTWRPVCLKDYNLRNGLLKPPPTGLTYLRPRWDGNYVLEEVS
jgi:hypothetical protein